MNGAETTVEPLSWWVAVICFTMCAIAFYGHFAYRRKGRLSSSWLRHNYFNEYVPPMIRYAPLNMLPVSGMFALWGGIVVMSHLPENDLTDYVIAILLILSVIAVAVGIKRHLSGYPDELKSEWLIEEERKRNTPEE
ncbi:hypothetical protein [Spirillospora sp. NPDC048819]|uniref:hypothetical protein n=1 Tax=Spirillospora sp. NPDC048819 TaxID=3155268 RepID=UPI0033EC176A